jgi:hypothetical protein
MNAATGDRSAPCIGISATGSSFRNATDYADPLQMLRDASFSFRRRSGVRQWQGSQHDPLRPERPQLGGMTEQRAVR